MKPTPPPRHVTHRPAALTPAHQNALEPTPAAAAPNPYAVEQPGAAGASVVGELVTALPAVYARLLAELDRLEEYRPGDPRNLYERVARAVLREDGSAPVRAWVYVAAPAVAARLRAQQNPVEGGDWLAPR
ncbi:gamma-glutamylcyclotransferase [Streptomyces sp. NPDC051677]|uniref:gamma-glutamylcyclotransferase n=1 Tax=Streptomyces sp. NPDC051677 TaxID=3365669 RepID=UPI0037CF07F8